MNINPNAALIALLLAVLPSSLRSDEGQVQPVLCDGQYIANGATYSAIVPPTGLLSEFKVGKRVFLSQSLAINTEHEHNANERIHACAAITRPESNVLVCSGETAGIRYEFYPSSIVCRITNSTDRTFRWWLTLDRNAEGVETDSRSEGKRVARAGVPSSVYGLNGVKVFDSGQTFCIKGAEVIYDSQRVRLDVPPGETRTVTLGAAPATPEETALFAVLPVFGEPLTVMSPMDWQVFQRQTRGEGLVAIRGRWTAAGDRLECRLGDLPWREIPVNPVSCAFSVQVPMKSGGWYRCEIRALKDGKTVASKVIEHVGVGEVFVTAGQSNSTNNGEEKLSPLSGLVSTFGGETWRPADDPQPGAHDDSRGGSFYPALGDALARHFNVPVAFAVTGHGGTRVEQWRPGGDLFTWMETRILQLGPQGFRAVLWHQGESDAATPEAVYYERLRAVIGESNRRAGWCFPWIIAQLGGAPLRQARTRLVAEDAAFLGPDTDLLRGENRGKGGKDVHFSRIGLIHHGEAWAGNIIPWLESQMKQ